jgi:Zn-dependent protease
MLIQLFSQHVPVLLIIIMVLVLLFSLSFHEFAHAFAADKLGDPTAKYLGRLTLDPRAHLDPIGTLLLLLAGFGWGKPVPYNPINLRHPKRDSAIVSFAGPLSNFILAGFFALLVHLNKSSFVTPLEGVDYIVSPNMFPALIESVLTLLVYYNLILGFFNLIPVYPLDGFRVVYGLLPINLAAQWEQMEQFGIFILLILVFTSSIDTFLFPLVTTAMKFLGV